MTTVAYTDGACSGNPGPGGWAWVRPDGPWASGADAHTTNQRMEITAAYEAVRANPGPLEIVSDSTYVVNCFRDSWWQGWIRRGWTNSKKEPVANRDLWEPFIELVRERGDVSFRWVKGHGGDAMNDVADRVAVAAAASQRGGSGAVLPDVSKLPTDPTGAAGLPTAGARRDGRLPDMPIGDHGVVILGHKPPELGGYGPNPIADGVRSQLESVLAARLQLDPDLVAVSGLRLGAEQIGAEAALAVGLPLVAVLPFPDADAPWPADSRQRFRDLCAAADEVVTLEHMVPENTSGVAGALARRDAWLARNVASAILVWDRESDQLARLASSLEDHMGDDVWYVEPR
ncbi:MAG TPA: SLOG family protein [Candidatus Nanopelagicales bacterium]|nr:SLOG family protein [Candidatus Nanopelagicales bacterium]